MVPGRLQSCVRPMGARLLMGWFDNGSVFGLDLTAVYAVIYGHGRLSGNPLPRPSARRRVGPRPTHAPGLAIRSQIRCGKAGCACADNPKARHGPYHSLTQAVGGKTRSRFIIALRYSKLSFPKPLRSSIGSTPKKLCTEPLNRSSLCEMPKWILPAYRRAFQPDARSLVRCDSVRPRAVRQLRQRGTQHSHRSRLSKHQCFDLPNIFFGTPAFGTDQSAETPRRIQFGSKILF